MRSAPMLDFPLDEFEQRLGKLFDTLERTDCAAVLLTNVENLRYYCNFRTSAWNSEFLSPAMLVVARSGGIALVTSPRMKATALATCCLDESDILTFDGFGEAATPEVLVPSIVSTLEYCLPLFDSSENLFRALKSGSVLSSDLERVVKPNVAFLRECGLGARDIAKLLIGHELFHYVEEQYKKEIWTRTYKIELWAPKFLHNRSTVGILGEIAAMAFTQELNRLPYSPYVMDAFLVYGYSPEAASGLYEEMMERAGRTPRLPQDGGPAALPDAAQQA